MYFYFHALFYVLNMEILNKVTKMLFKAPF